MTGPATETVDAVVIGATIRGLVASHVLAGAGQRTVLVERSMHIGGTDGSFVTVGGSRFDHGLHALDFERSEVATQLFTRAVGGAVHRTVLRRGIALRGRVMPYAPTVDEMPDEVRHLLPSGEIVDDIGDDLPTRERLAACYGPPFTDLVFDEVLPSFPSEARHLAFGVDEARLLTNIYPWFFPRARRTVPSHDESRAFHDRLRAGIAQEILYPALGGFGGFAQGFLDMLDPSTVEVITGARDLEVDVGEGHRVDAVRAKGRRFEARRYFWAEGWPALCHLLDLPCQHVATDRVMLGSFRLDRPASTGFHEILVGDPARWINRVHFPARFRRSEEPLLQVEFAVPVHALEWERPDAEWRERWWDDVRRLGIVGADHRVEEFDFRTFAMHFNGFGAEGEPLRDADPDLLDAASNIVPVVPSMANLNLNRYVPRVVRELTAVLGAPTG